MFNVFALLLNDASKTATPLTNGAIKQTLRQFATVSDNRLLQLMDCRVLSTLIDHLLKNIPNSIIDRNWVWVFFAHMPGSINVDHATGQWRCRLECVVLYFTRWCGDIFKV